MPVLRRGLRRERVTHLTPREEQLVALLRERPRPARELAEVCGTSVLTMCTGISRLAKKISLVAQFRYGQMHDTLVEEITEEEG